MCAMSITISSCHRRNKYDWTPTECAPKEYPAQIFNGNFFYGDAKSIYIPKGKEVNYGWGEDGSIDIAGEQMKEAPDRLEITYLSYTEHITYTGTFQLDRPKIDSLFNEGFGEINNAGEKVTYDALKVGLAPGGLVVVWITGSGRQLEVGHFQAHVTTNVNWGREFSDMQIPLNDYIKMVIANLPIEVQNEVKNHKIPVERWKNWRKRYSWHTRVNDECHPLTLFTSYFNAEQTLNTANGTVMPRISQLAVPKRMYILWTDNKNNAMRTDINFEEEEVSHAFSQLKGGEAAELNIHVNPDNGDAEISFPRYGNLYRRVH